jgi:hypothetical protein
MVDGFEIQDIFFVGIPSDLNFLAAGKIRFSSEMTVAL